MLAKPAEQTPLTAALAVQLLHRAGVPPEVLHLLPGGPEIGAALTDDPRICGVVFTGSTQTARRIEQHLAAREGAIATLIAETGGINVMIVDSSALPEQVVLDCIASAFNSAGQRCSALRILVLQEEIAPRVLELLAGQMDELVLGAPWRLHTDIGPVIDGEALTGAGRLCGESHQWRTLAASRATACLGRHAAPVSRPWRLKSQALPSCSAKSSGRYCTSSDTRPTTWMRSSGRSIAMGYGLTLGIHTRIDSAAAAIAERVQVGNVYVNRNMIGAVVGVQPFGGCGLSGTGPKAGGPHYLQRFVTEQTITINTAALGGNTSLLSL